MHFLVGETEDKSKEREKERIEESSKLYVSLLKNIPEGQECVSVSWEEGKVLVHRGDNLINTITKFTPISTRQRFPDTGQHRGNYDWEVSLISAFCIPEKAQGVGYQKDRMMYFTRYLGHTPKFLLRQLQACMLNAFVPKDLINVANNSCRTGRRRTWITKYVNNLSERRDTIRQCLLDGQENIVPFIVSSEDKVTPSELRSDLGKGNWKTLLRNSVTRNTLLSRRINICGVAVINTPSTLLRGSGEPVICAYTIKVLKGLRSLGKPDTVRKVHNTITDTRRMYSQLQKELPKQSKSWDWGKWEERHSWCTEKINEKKYSKDVFDKLKEYPTNFESAGGKYTATLLRSAYDIRNEGENMHHCVGSYSDLSEKGDYLVLSMSDERGKVSTLGCKVHQKESVVTLNQHYGYCNATIKDKDLIKFSKEVIENLNIVMKGGANA